LPGEVGVTAIETSVAVGTVTTVKCTVLLVTPDKDAVILVVPAATPVASPPAVILPADGLELFQVTWVVMSAVEVSE
jgi:hypothetical protein